MIPHINDLMNVWAEWVLTGRRVVGLDYPSQCAFTRLAPASGQARGASFNDDAWLVENAVQSLAPDLKRVVMVFYLQNATAEQMARDLHCSRDTLYARLHRAHTEVMGYISENC